MKNNLILVLGIALILSALVGYFVPKIEYYKLQGSTRVDLSKEQYDNDIYRHEHDGLYGQNQLKKYSQQRNVNFPLMIVSFLGTLGVGLIINFIVTNFIKQREHSTFHVTEKAIKPEAIKSVGAPLGLIHNPISKFLDLVNTPLSSGITNKMSLRETENSGHVKDDEITKYTKVGGWLLVLCIILTIVLPLRSFVGLSSSYDEMIKYRDVFPDLQVAYYINSAITMIVSILSILVGSWIWALDKDSVSITKTFLIVYFCAVVIILLVQFFALLPSVDNLAVNLEIGKRLLGALLFSVVWYWYLSVSKRVKGTFVVNSTVSESLIHSELHN